MNSLDLLVLIPITIGFVFGLFKGLIKELTSLAAIVFGIYGAKIFAPSVSEMLEKSFEFSSKTSKPVAYLILFVTIAVILLVIANMLDKLFSSLSLGGFNKLMGGIFGGLKYALIVSVLLNIFDALDSRFSIVKIETKEQSLTYKPLMKFGPALWNETKTNKKFDFDKDTTDEDNKIKNY
ncbi:MAG: CvpA family protein [Paludibacter sp.]|nr:CvpA family protein [Paludibacter sp.]